MWNRLISFWMFVCLLGEGKWEKDEKIEDIEISLL